MRHSSGRNGYVKHAQGPVENVEVVDETHNRCRKVEEEHPRVREEKGLLDRRIDSQVNRPEVGKGRHGREDAKNATHPDQDMQA